MTNGITYNYIVVYDLPAENTKLRNKIVKCCASYGLVRLQYSVFIGKLTRETLENLVVALEELTENEIVDLRVYHICQHVREPEMVIQDTYVPPVASSILTRRQHEQHSVIIF